MAFNLYTPLDVNTWQFRLLEFQSSGPGRTIRCKFQTHSISKQLPSYTALSYCWGDARETRIVTINQKQVAITANLYNALQYLRIRGIKLVWVDQLCINQADIQEQGLQVRIMKHIYRKAQETYAWIGNSEEAARGLRFLQSLIDGTITPADTRMENISGRDNESPPTSYSSHRALFKVKVPIVGGTLTFFNPWEKTREQHPEQSACGSQSHHELRNMEYASGITALIHLLNQDYWQRRWIIQEIAVSKKPIVVCGDFSMEFDEMIKPMFECISKRNLECIQNETPLDPHIKRFYDTILKTLLFRAGWRQDRQPGLINAVTGTTSLASSREHDKLFALLGICGDAELLIPTPDYTDSLHAISLDLTKQLILRNAAFDIIFYQDRPDRANSLLPSWCPNWFGGNLRGRVREVAERAPILAKNEGARALDGEEGQLVLQGIEFGSVVALTSVLGASGPIAQTFARYQGRIPTMKVDEYYQGAQTAAVFACLRASTTSPQRPYYSYSNGSATLNLEGHILHALSMGKSSMLSIDFKDILPALDTRLKGISSWLNENDEFFRDCSSRGRPVYYSSTSLSKTVLASPFLTAELGTFREEMREASRGESITSARLAVLHNGTMALVPSDTKLDDKVCLLAGCDSSAALREKTPPGSQPKFFEVIGRGFVCMSKADCVKYEAFSERPQAFSGERGAVSGIRTVFGGGPQRSSSEAKLMGFLGPIRENPQEYYNDLIKGYKRLDEWNTFTLV